MTYDRLLLLADWLFDHGGLIAAGLFFGGIYLFWACRERRHVRAYHVEHRHGKPLSEYREGLKRAHGIKDGSHPGRFTEKRLKEMNRR